MNAYFMPMLDIEQLKEDDKLNVVIADEKYIISLQKNDRACICSSNLDQFQYYFRIHHEAAELLRYLAGKYNLLIGGDGCLNDAGGRACYYGSSMPEDSIEILFTEYAAAEMIEFKDYYGWSDEFIEHLNAIRSNNREVLGIKDNYQIDDIVTFEYCGPDNSVCISGRVIFANDDHKIVHIPFYTHNAAADINRNCADYKKIEAIIGVPVERLRKYEYDRFIDLADPATYLPWNTFGAPITELGTIIRH